MITEVIIDFMIHSKQRNLIILNCYRSIVTIVTKINTQINNEMAPPTAIVVMCHVSRISIKNLFVVHLEKISYNGKE